MIKKLWRQWLYNRMANIIEKAAASEEYVRYQYLCLSIGIKSSNPLKRMAIRLIADNLRGVSTLSSTIRRAIGEEGYGWEDQMWFGQLDWSARIVIHRAYWAKFVAELRKGNPTWGKYFNSKEILVDAPWLDTKSDKILEQLRKDAA